MVTEVKSYIRLFMNGKSAVMSQAIRNSHAR